MELSTLRYAQKNLDITAQEDGFITSIELGKLYIEFPSGRSLDLSDKEVRYQAVEYLNAQIRDIENN
jgi:hypothetical protein